MTSDEIKRTVSMQEVVSGYGIRIDRKGFCCCPFHKEKTASMKIYKDSYNCFGCGANGDVFSFVMEMNGCDFKTAYIYLGGTYEEKSHSARKLFQYRMQKRRETEMNRERKVAEQKKKLFSDIKFYRFMKNIYPPLSDEWCNAVNKLEMAFYRLEELTEKRCGE